MDDDLLVAGHIHNKKSVPFDPPIFQPPSDPSSNLEDIYIQAVSGFRNNCGIFSVLAADSQKNALG